MRLSARFMILGAFALGPVSSVFALGAQDVPQSKGELSALPQAPTWLQLAPPVLLESRVRVPQRRYVRGPQEADDEDQRTVAVHVVAGAVIGALLGLSMIADDGLTGRVGGATIGALSGAVLGLVVGHVRPIRLPRPPRSP